MPVSLRGHLCANVGRGAADRGDDFPPEPDLTTQEGRPGCAPQIVELFFAHKDADNLIRNIVNFEGIPEFSWESLKVAQVPLGRV